MLSRMLRVLVVLVLIGVGTVIVVHRGGTGPAGSASRAPSGGPTTTLPPAPTTATTAAPAGDGVAPGPAAAVLPDTGGLPDPGGADVPPPPTAATPESVGPPPTVPESGVPWLLPATGALTVGVGAVVVVRRKRWRRP